MAGKQCDCSQKLRLEFERRSTFLTASGILSTILLVWAQLWPLLLTIVPRYASSRQVLGEISGNIEVGLAWIYGALLLALLSFGLSVATPSKSSKSDILNQSTRRYRSAISCFELSLVMGLVAVVQSLASVSYKLNKHMPFWEPTLNIGGLGAWLWLAIGPFLLFAILHTCNRVQCRRCQNCACFKKVIAVCQWVSFAFFVGVCLAYGACKAL